MYSEYSFHTACASVVLRYFLTLVLPISVNKVSLKTLYMKTCLASNNSCSSGEGPGVKVGSSISETSWDFAVMKRSIWNLSKYLSSFKVEYADASLLILFLKDASSKCIGDLTGRGDVVDLRCDMWFVGAGDMCEFCFSFLSSIKADLMSYAVNLVHCSSIR